jgi:hypothetical protein
MPTYDGIVFLQPLAEGRANVTVGPYAYYDDRDRARDANVLRALEDGWGHRDFGVYATVGTGGTVTVGDEVRE